MACLFFIQPTVFAEDVDCSTVSGSLLEECQNQADEGTTTGPAFGTNEEEPQEAGAALPDQNVFVLFMQMFGALAIVIALIFIIFRFINKRTRSFRTTQILQNVGGVPLGANRSVQLVKVGDRLLVVGVGETIQLLKEIEDESEKEKILTGQQEMFDSLNDPLSNVTKWIQGRVKKSKTSPYHERTKTDEQQAFKHVLSKQLTNVTESQERIRKALREKDKS